MCFDLDSGFPCLTFALGWALWLICPCRALWLVPGSPPQTQACRVHQEASREQGEICSGPTVSAGGLHNGLLCAAHSSLNGPRSRLLLLRPPGTAAGGSASGC